jgi:MoaA/NifB/PqqE/SkfB family radical SAM enzyme
MNGQELEDLQQLASQWHVPLRVDTVLTPRTDGDVAPLDYAAAPSHVREAMTRFSPEGAPPQVDRQVGGLNCGLGRTTISLDPYGNVFPCIQWQYQSIGNVLQQRLVRLWETSQLRAEVALIAQQANDRLIEIGGSAARYPYCPAIAKQRTGDPLTPDPTFLEHARIAGEVAMERR